MDAAGDAFVAGWTYSTDFPTMIPLQATNRAGQFGTNGFVSKLNAAGSQLLFSTYLGGTINDLINGVAVDRRGNAYVTGKSESADFPTTPGVLQPHGVRSSAATSSAPTRSLQRSMRSAPPSRIRPISRARAATGARGLRSTGRQRLRRGHDGVAVLPDPRRLPGDHRVHGPEDAFVTKLNTKATHVLYSSYLGGSAGVGT